MRCAARPTLPPPPMSGAFQAFYADKCDITAIAAWSLMGFGAEALSAATFWRRTRHGHALLFGLRHKEEIVAYLLLYLNQRTGRAYVNEVLVVPAWRGFRLSTWLLSAAGDVARQSGMHSLAAHVRASNVPSLRAKLSQGMHEVKRLPAWYPGEEEAIYLRQKL